MADFKILRLGSKGPQTELLQLGLTRAGYATAADGIFGNNTQKSLIAFQRSHDLDADGIAGRLTWNALTPYLTGYTVYTVGRGDSLYKIATQLGTSIFALKTANPKADIYNLAIGARLIVPFTYPVVPTNISFTSTVLELVMTGLSARYPFITVGSAGKSIMGKELYYLKIGNGARQVFYNASHHGNEWITTPLLLSFAEEYAAALSGGGTVFGISAASLAIAMVAGAVFALWIHAERGPLAYLIQLMGLIPWVTSMVVAAMLWKWILQEDAGLLNYFVRQLGGEKVGFLTDKRIAVASLIFVMTWRVIGYVMVQVLAGLKSIAANLEEAAYVDGATKWQQTRYITIPMLKTIMIIMFIMAVGKIFNSDFGLFYRTTRNSNALTSVFLTLDVYVYNSIFNSSRPVYGYISAAGFLQSVLGCVTMIVANAIVRKVDNESALF